MDRPFKLINRSKLSENRIFDIYYDHLQSPHASIEHYLVVAPKRSRDDMITGVGILPVQDGQVGLLRMFRHAVDAWSLEIPRGLVEADEALADAARRELAEETGLVASAGQVRPLGTFMPDSGVLAARISLWLAQGFRTVGGSDPQEIGLGALVWLDLEQAMAMADRSAIEDASTLLALDRYRRLSRSGELGAGERT